MTKSDKKSLCIIVSAFVLSRILYYHLGVRFDISHLHTAWQFIDVDLLQNRLFESLFFLHSQPPMFNLFLGIVLKLFPSNYPIIFHIIYLVLGLTLSISIFLIMRAVKVQQSLSVILTILFMCNPSVVIYENWLFYSYPIATCLCLSALFFYKFLLTEKGSYAFAFFVLAAVLILTRGMFHLIWLIGIILFLIFVKQKMRKLIFQACLLPLLIVILVYVKNAALFGSMTTSSTWSGYHVQKITIGQLSRNQILMLVLQGKISEVSIYDLLKDKGIEWYQTHGFFDLRKTGVPVLDRLYRSTGKLNYNHLGFTSIAKRYQKDGFYVLTHFPLHYLKALKRGYYIYFFPAPTDITFPNRQYIHKIEKIYNFMFYGISQEYDLYSRNLNFSDDLFNIKWDWFNGSLFILLILYHIFLILYGMGITVRGIRDDKGGSSEILVISYLWINIIYVTVASNALATWATNRYRFPSEPFYLILLGVVLTQALRCLKIRNS